MAIGVRIRASLPGKFLNTSGWVYLIGRPQLTASGASLKLDNLHYSLVQQNEIWDDLAELFDSQILSALRAHSSIELTPMIRDAEEKIASGVNSAAIQGLRIQTDRPRLALENVSVAPDSFVVIGGLIMKFNVELTSGLLGR